MNLRVFLVQPYVEGVLGPDKRAVLWVQGCTIGCKGCISPLSWQADNGIEIAIDDLLEWVRGQEGIEGITVSGGEPFQQAEALTQLFEPLRKMAYGVICYTGYRYERLLCCGSDSQKRLLRYVDLLIDGPYMERLQSSSAWRGSSNQRLLCLSSRYKQAVREMLDAGDQSQGLKWFFDPTEGSTVVAGVPDTAGFRTELAQRLGKVKS